MYRRFLAVFVLLWIGLFGLLSVSAQDGPAWIAWLYNADTGEIMEINSTSEGDVSNTWSLPLAQAFNAYPYRIAVSPSGDIVAYVVADTSSETPNRQLLVYNTTIGGIVAAYPLPPEAEADTIDIDPDGLIFDEENHLLAYGYVLVDRSENATEPNWEIVVIDYQLGEVIQKWSAGRMISCSSTPPALASGRCGGILTSRGAGRFRPDSKKSPDFSASVWRPTPRW
jgi:hypothetical protein